MLTDELVEVLVLVVVVATIQVADEVGECIQLHVLMSKGDEFPAFVEYGQTFHTMVVQVSIIEAAM